MPGGGCIPEPVKIPHSLEEESVKFAGIKVSSGGYEIDPARLEAIRDFERPRTNNQLQRWLGLCMSLEEFASCPLKDQLFLKRELLRNNYSGDLPWNQEKVQSSRQPGAFFQTHCRCCSPSIKLWHQACWPTLPRPRESGLSSSISTQDAPRVGRCRRGQRCWQDL